MELRSLSASAMKVWQSCPARAAASSINRVPESPSAAADFGSACHQALEFYVRAVHLERGVTDDVNILIKLFLEAYNGYFPGDRTNLDVGVEMMKKWHARTDFTDREVLTVEVKHNFQLPVSIGTITFNYIFDRVDRIVGSNDIEIVDYKSWLMPRTLEHMESDIQLRSYALAGAIQFKDAQPERVWTTFDQLRYEPVGVVFTREENVQTWEYLRVEAEKMIAARVEDLPERLNTECAWCVRRHACTKLQSHAAVMGPLSLDDPIAATKRLAEVQGMIKGLGALEQDLQQFLIGYSHENGDIESWEADGVIANVSFSRRRQVDPQEVARIIGEAKFAELGSITLKKLDDLLKSGELDAEQKRAINSLITLKFGDPTVKAQYKGGLKK